MVANETIDIDNGLEFRRDRFVFGDECFDDGAGFSCGDGFESFVAELLAGGRGLIGSGFLVGREAGAEIGPFCFG